MLTGLFIAELVAERNEFEGEVPDALFSLPNLKKLDLGNTPGLVGSIPETIGVTQNIEHLRLHNTSIGGTLPLGLFDLINLQTLDLSASSFSGTLPVEFGKLSNTTSILLYGNTFTGTIPDAFALLATLSSLELDGNELTGTMPEALCNRTAQGFLDLRELTADCSEVSCTCCDRCY